MKQKSFEDTIAGIATAPGEAGISIIRISGDQALAIADKIIKTQSGKQVSELSNRYMANGWVTHNDKLIDEVLICPMHGPKSFTAEDVVEIHSHGGGVISRLILKILLESGARLAERGEFTQRAFINGRIDLTQAEAINDVISAKSELALDVVVNQLKGKLYKKIGQLKEDISWCLALANAGIDFPEEDVIFDNEEEVREKLQHCFNDVSQLIKSADHGMLIREGYQVALVGQPNAGKSSLMNAMLGTDRAIVTEIAGTTRDTLQESLEIQGVPVTIIDTAGIRKTSDQIEQQGIDRSKDAIEKADLVLWMVDLTDPSFELDGTLPDAGRLMIILNKKDLHEGEIEIPEEWAEVQQMTISAHDPESIEELKAKLFEILSGGTGLNIEDNMLTNLRQKEAAILAEEALDEAIESLEDEAGEELLSIDLSRCLDALGDIVGETTPDDMLNQIFANFCIGK